MLYQLLVACVVSSLIWGVIGVSNPDEFLSTPELIVKYGYPVEIHTVTTADGYILTMHRIPYSPKSPAAPNKPVAFLQHGLFCSSTDWIVLGPERSLGYLLADAGYDVWLGNARGNTYSKNHTTLSVSDYKFWDFSWHQMGIYDLPAAFDYVLELTGQEKLSYAGHSMGTTMFYVCMSMKPEYNDRIQIMASLAPIAYMAHTTNALAKFGSYLPGSQVGLQFLEILGLGELLPTNSLMQFLSDSACSEGSITQGICSSIVFLLCGYDPSQVNTTVLPVLLSHTPAGVSTKTILHYAQEIGSISHNFKQYDYYVLNPIVYGSVTPPSYKVANITAPIYLMYGDNDPFGDPTDVFKLFGSLPNVKGIYRVALDSFNHIDFLWANDIKPLVNDEVIRVFQEYQSS
ncbi:Lipase 3 [Blattella germanica]|nr:Lipase 3 [Blattella germanica]